jgi:hypothetical protein
VPADSGRSYVEARGRRTIPLGQLGGERNMKRLVGILALLAVAYVVVSSIPDIARYIKIREM